MRLNKWIYIITVILILGLVISFFAFNNSNKTKESSNVIDTDCIDNNCEKDDDNKNNQNNDNKKEDSDSKKNESTDSTKNEIVPSTQTNNNSNTNSTSVNNNSNTNSINSSSNVNQIPSNNETGSNVVPTATEEPGKFIVSDDDHVWDNQTDIDVFKISKIRPGDNGTYNFVVNNKSKKTTIYKIVFEETNEYQANILYKLKINDKYVAGDKDTYVKYDVLNLPEKELKSGEKNYYTIEWKWVDADNDPIVGYTASKVDATYELKVIVNSTEAVEVDEYTPNTVDKILYYVGLIIVSITRIVIILLLLNNKKKREI